MGADASPKPKQTNRNNVDVNNSSTAVFHFSTKVSWIRQTYKFIVAKGWPEYLDSQRLTPVTDIIRLTKFLVSISLTTALRVLFSVHTAQVHQLYHLQLDHPLDKPHCARISSTPVQNLYCFVKTLGAPILLGSFLRIFIPSSILACVHLYCWPVCVHYKQAVVISCCTLLHFETSDFHGPVCSAELYTCTGCICSLYCTQLDLDLKTGYEEKQIHT